MKLVVLLISFAQVKLFIFENFLKCKSELFIKYKLGILFQFQGFLAE